MSFTAKILMNYPVSIASNVTPPSLFTISKASHAHPCLSLPFKPLSSSSLSFTNFLSLKKQKETLLRVSAIADMEEEDDIPDVFEDQEQEFEGDLNWGDSENDGFGEQDEEAEVYAGNLPSDVTGEQFETFNEAGGVEIAEKEPRSRDSVMAARGEENKIIRDVFEDLEQESEGDLNFGASEDYGSGEENDEAKVYVGNLAYNVTGEQLAETFNKAGVVEMAEIKVHRDTNLSRGFAFVTMSSVEEAEKAMEMFDNYEINGREIIVRKAARRGSKPERLPPVYRPKSKIYVGSLPWSVDDDRLEELFSAFGRVISARVVSDIENGGRSRGFGFVEMSNDSEMNLAISNLDGQIVDGRPIRVNVATENRRSSF